MEVVSIQPELEGWVLHDERGAWFGSVGIKSQPINLGKLHDAAQTPPHLPGEYGMDWRFGGMIFMNCSVRSGLIKTPSLADVGADSAYDVEDSIRGLPC